MNASRNLGIAAALLALLATPSRPIATQTQQPGPSSSAPRFSLAIELDRDAIRGDGEIPLEITMTNTSGKDLPYGSAFGPPYWPDFCQFDMRDSGGKPLEEKTSMRQFLGGKDGVPKIDTFGGPALVLGPGEKAHREVLLNRIYDLSKPGKYTIRALRSDDEFAVESNIVTANITRDDHRAGDRKPRFSITLSTPYNAVNAGYQVPVRVEVRNISKEGIRLRTWQEETHFGAGTSHEFASGIEGRDPLGNSAPRTKEGRDLDGEKAFPAGVFTFVRLEPGESYEETKLVGKLYDLSRPGRYEFQVALSDPITNLVVRSNPVSVEVLGPDRNPQPSKQGPFLLDNRPPSDSVKKWFGFKAAVYLAITNRSDHPIDFDIGFGINDVDVFDHDGNFAPLTETGLRYNSGPLPRGDPPWSHPQTIQHLQPGETKSGGMIKLDSLYDLSRPGRYTVQVKAFDGETKTIVESNRITITVDR
jgi:hypothetical protein